MEPPSGFRSQTRGPAPKKLFTWTANVQPSRVCCHYENPKSKVQRPKSKARGRIQVSRFKLEGGAREHSYVVPYNAKATGGRYKSRKAAAKAGGGFRRKSLILSTFINFYQVLTLKKDTMGTTQKATGRFEYRHDRRTNFPSTCCRRYAASWDNSRSVFGAFVVNP
jgi:hypothetical protein